MAWSLAAPIAGAVIGNMLSSGDANRANDMYNQALAQYAGLEVPDIEKMKLNLEQYTSQGQLDPYLEQLVSLGPSAYNDIMLDPTGENAQRQALEAYTQMSQQGLTDADIAGRELARQDAAAHGQAANQAVLQNMQQRGMAGSNMEAMMRAMANQNSAQNLQKAQLEQAQASEAARRQALQNMAGIGSSLTNQAYTQAAQKAGANDAISQFNAANSQNVGARNVQARNLAQQQNLQNQQNLMNQNVNLRNQQQGHNKGLLQQDFGNKIQLAGAKSGAYTGAGNQASQQAANTAGMWGGIGQGVGTILGGMGKTNTNTQNQEQPSTVNYTGKYSNIV